MPDDLSWHTCDQGCTQLEEDNLFYKYLNQSVCTAHPSRWLLGFNYLGYTDWQATVIASQITPFHPTEERLKLVGKLSDKKEDITKVIKELETFAELEIMYNELRKRMDIQQLVFDINNYLRVTVLQHKDCFYSEGQYAHCSIEIQQMNNRVRGISFFMLHVVFHMQLRLQKPDVKEWWISICNKKAMQDGYETLKLQVNIIFQEYFQNLVGELELRSDGAGKKYNWTISRVEEVVTTKAEASTQDGTLISCHLYLTQLMELSSIFMDQSQRGRKTHRHKLLKNGNFNINRYFIRNFIEHKRKLLNTISYGSHKNIVTSKRKFLNFKAA